MTMKKYLFTLMMAAMSVTAWAGQYVLTVNSLGEADNGREFRLVSFDTGDTLAIAKANQEKIVFKGTVAEPVMARVIGGDYKLDVVVETGQIQLDADSEITSGTALNNNLASILKEINAAVEEYRNIEKKFKNGEIDEQTAQMDAMLIPAKIENALNSGYERNKDNVVGQWAFCNYITVSDGVDYNELTEMLKDAPANYASLKRVQKSLKSLRAVEETAEGKQFTDFAMTDTKGNVTRLSDYLKPGQYTLVDFWASWCGPCRREIKNTLKPLYEKYNGKGMQFVGVAVWDEPEDTEMAIEQMKLPWPIMKNNHQSSDETEMYGIQGIPHIMILDGSGKILSRGLQGDDLVQFVDSLFGVTPSTK